MSTRFTLFAILFAVICGRLTAQQRGSFVVRNLPGRLDNFLKTVPNASLATKALGKLAGFQDSLMDAETHVTRKADVTATFAALAASSRTDSSLKAKGIEVRFEYLDEHEGKKLFQVAYLDENGLLRFHDDLEELAEIQSFALTHLEDFHSNEFPACNVVGEVNRMTSAEDILRWKTDKAVVLLAGWYWKADETGNGMAKSGVCLDVDPGGASFFPDATLDQLIEIVAKGRAFLAAN